MFLTRDETNTNTLIEALILEVRKLRSAARLVMFPTKWLYRASNYNTNWISCFRELRSSIAILWVILNQSGASTDNSSFKPQSNQRQMLLHQ